MGALDQQIISSNTGSFLIPELWEKELLYNNKPNYIFMQFATDATVANASTVKWAVVGDFSDGNSIGTIHEGTTIPNGTITISQITASPAEYGGAINWSRKEADMSFTDIKNNVVFKSLVKDYETKLDLLAYNELKTGTTVVNGGTWASGNAGIGTVFAGTLGNNDFALTAAKLSDAVAILETQNAPKINGMYIGVFHPLQIRALKNDGTFIAAKEYASPQDLLNGEAGEYDMVKLLTTTAIPAVTLPFGTSGTLSVREGIVMGADALGKGFYIPVELHPYDDVNNDAGRTKALKWYANGLVKNLKPQNVVRVRTTSATV